MTAKTIEYCVHCGAKVVEYRFNLASRSMLRPLELLYNTHGFEFARIIDLPGISRADCQSGNWLKGKYWDLIEPFADRSGLWRVKPRFKFFYDSKLPLAPYAVMYRNELVRFEGERVLYGDIHWRRTKQRDDYVADASPHKPTP